MKRPKEFKFKMWRDTIRDSTFEPLRERFLAKAKRLYPDDEAALMKYLTEQLYRIRIFRDWCAGYTYPQLAQKHRRSAYSIQKIVEAKYRAARRLQDMKAD